ncbi:hypothetical protein PGT21_010322 [Puccinia graminis f. sp. tritici]|uniref:Uncharacterized protein n=1 Tax=Puccinia graminis f. sp. tritici TaxID=56615 RepID=A0A5B0Q5J3_PUCGR|nr:hypothetical protein PGT21_010322 [Puccinia graminis f. sp. tritici]
MEQLQTIELFGQQLVVKSKLDPSSTINHQSSGRLGHSSTRLGTLLNNQSYELTGHPDSHLTRSLHSI